MQNENNNVYILQQTFNNNYPKHVISMYKQYSEEEIEDFARFFRDIPTGRHFMITTPLSIMSEESPDKWHKLIRKIVNNDRTVVMTNYEIKILKALIGEGYSCESFLLAGQFLRERLHI